MACCPFLQSSDCVLSLQPSAHWSIHVPGQARPHSISCQCCHHFSGRKGHGAHGLAMKSLESANPGKPGPMTPDQASKGRKESLHMSSISKSCLQILCVLKPVGGSFPVSKHFTIQAHVFLQASFCCVTASCSVGGAMHADATLGCLPLSQAASSSYSLSLLQGAQPLMLDQGSFTPHQSGQTPLFQFPSLTLLDLCSLTKTDE